MRWLTVQFRKVLVLLVGKVGFAFVKLNKVVMMPISKLQNGLQTKTLIEYHFQ